MQSKRLAITSQIVLSVRAGSGSVERSNNHFKHIFPPERASLHHRRVNQDTKICINLKQLRKVNNTTFKKNKKQKS